jgi:hypothetical protein
MRPQDRDRIIDVALLGERVNQLPNGVPVTCIGPGPKGRDQVVHAALPGEQVNQPNSSAGAGQDPNRVVDAALPGK